MASYGEKDDENRQRQLNVSADKIDELLVAENIITVECLNIKKQENLPDTEVEGTKSTNGGKNLYDKTDVNVAVEEADTTSSAEGNIVNIRMAENEKESSGEETHGTKLSSHSYENKAPPMGHKASNEQGANIHSLNHAAGISLSAVDASSVSEYCMCAASRSLSIAGNSCVYVQVHIDDNLVERIKEEGTVTAEISAKGVFARLLWSGLPTNSDYHEGKINIDIENNSQKEEVFNEFVKQLVADGACNARVIVEKMLEKLGICITQFAHGSIQMLYVTQRTISKDDEAIITTIVEKAIITNKIRQIVGSKIQLKITVEHFDDHKPLPLRYMIPQSQGKWNKTPKSEDLKHLVSEIVRQEMQQMSSAIKEEVVSVTARQQEYLTRGMMNKLSSLEKQIGNEFFNIQLEIQKLVAHVGIKLQQSLSDGAAPAALTLDEHEPQAVPEQEHLQMPINEVPTGSEYEQEHMSLDGSGINIDPATLGEIPQPGDGNREERIESHGQDPPSPAMASALPNLPKREKSDFYKVMCRTDESLSPHRPSTENKDLEDAEKDFLKENKDLVSAVNHFHDNSSSNKALQKLKEIIENVREKQSRCEVHKAEHGMNSVLCLDISRNMQHCLKEVKDLLKRFMNEVEENTMLEGTHLEENIGLVLFGDEVEVKCLLTNEFECVNKILGLEGSKKLKAGSTNNRPLLEALLTSLVVIKESKPLNSILEIGKQNYLVRPRIILITTDGVNDHTTCQTLDSLSIIMKHTDVDFTVDSVPVGKSTLPIQMLENLAKKTGGRFLPSERQNELGRYYRQQYVIGQTLDRIYSTVPPELLSAKQFFEDLAGKFSLAEREKKMLLPQLMNHLEPHDQPVRGTITGPGSFHTPTENVPLKHPPAIKKPQLKERDCVQRGPDWQYENQDGGKGCKGIVCSVEKEKTVEVKWNVTQRTDKYRYGLENKYEVELVTECGSADGLSKRKYQLQTFEGSDSGLSSMMRQPTPEEYSAGELSSFKGTKCSEQEPSDLEVDAGVWMDDEVPETVKQRVITWQWKDRGDNWRLFSDQQINQIENFYQNKSKTCVLYDDALGKKYQLDFQRQKRRDLNTGNYQDIRRKEMIMEDLHKLQDLSNLVSYWKD